MRNPDVRFEWVALNWALDRGLEDLMQAHWEEIEDHQDVAPLDVDWRQYHQLAASGFLKLRGALCGDDLIGYNAFFVHATLHHASTLWAVNDGIFLDPAHRRGDTGKRLITETEDALKELGVRIILYSVKDDFAGKRQRGNAGRLLARLGYQTFDRSWSKVL